MTQHSRFAPAAQAKPALPPRAKDLPLPRWTELNRGAFAAAIAAVVRDYPNRGVLARRRRKGAVLLQHDKAARKATLWEISA